MPFHASRQPVLVMWSNLTVLSTSDGRVLWASDYPEPPSGFPRMMGGVTNSRSIFVSWTGQTFGGD